MTSVEFTHYLTAYYRRKNIILTITQTQKWTYISYSIYIFLNSKNLLFNNDSPYCWPYSRIFPQLYYSQKDNPELFEESGGLYQVSVPADLIQSVELALNHFRDCGAGELSTWSHRKGAA